MQEPASFNRSKTQGNNRYQKNVRFDESVVDQSASFDKTNSNKPIEETKIPSMIMKAVSNKLIQDVLSDVTKHSQFYFDSMDNSFLNDLKNQSKPGDKWKVLSQIIAKYPNNEGVAATLNKLKDENEKLK